MASNAASGTDRSPSVSDDATDPAASEPPECEQSSSERLPLD
jgi:hypothetical protein